MRSQTFRMIAGWSLALAVSAGAGQASSIITDPTPADASVSMLELEQELFGLDTADGYSIAQASQLWTSNANAALYSNMLALITTLGGDQGLIAELFQPGAIFAGQSNPLLVASTPAVSNFEVLSSQAPVPEPATMGLLGGTLLFLCCYALLRTARVKAALRRMPSYGPIRRTD
jgi:hypothetical protein